MPELCPVTREGLKAVKKVDPELAALLVRNNKVVDDISELRYQGCDKGVKIPKQEPVTIVAEPVPIEHQEIESNDFF